MLLSSAGDKLLLLSVHIHFLQFRFIINGLFIFIILWHLLFLVGNELRSRQSVTHSITLMFVSFLEQLQGWKIKCLDSTSGNIYILFGTHERTRNIFITNDQNDD